MFFAHFLASRKWVARRGDDDMDVGGRAMQEQVPRPGKPFGCTRANLSEDSERQSPHPAAPLGRGE